MVAFIIPTPTKSLLGRANFGWADGRGWGRAMGRLKMLQAKTVTIKAKPCTGNAGRPDIPIRQVGR